MKPDLTIIREGHVVKTLAEIIEEMYGIIGEAETLWEEKLKDLFIWDLNMHIIII